MPRLDLEELFEEVRSFLAVIAAFAVAAGLLYVAYCVLGGLIILWLFCWGGQFGP